MKKNVIPIKIRMTKNVSNVLKCSFMLFICSILVECNNSPKNRNSSSNNNKEQNIFNEEPEISTLEGGALALNNNKLNNNEINQSLNISSQGHKCNQCQQLCDIKNLVRGICPQCLNNARGANSIVQPSSIPQQNNANNFQNQQQLNNNSINTNLTNPSIQNTQLNNTNSSLINTIPNNQPQLTTNSSKEKQNIITNIEPNVKINTNTSNITKNEDINPWERNEIEEAEDLTNQWENDRKAINNELSDDISQEARNERLKEALKTFNFKQLNLNNPQEEKYWDDNLPNISENISKSDVKINKDFLLYNPFVKLQTDVSMLQHLGPLSGFGKAVMLEFQNKMIQNGDYTEIKFEDDYGTISFSKLLDSLSSEMALNGKIESVISTDNISRDEIKSHLYASFMAIKESLDKDDIDKAAMGISYLAPLVAAHHCHGRTLNIINKLGELYGNNSITPQTFSGKVYKFLSNFKIECFNYAIVTFYSGDSSRSRGGADVHYKNWVISKTSSIINVPGKDISSKDAHGSHYAPQRLRNKMDWEIREEFNKYFNKYYNVDTITDLIHEQVNATSNKTIVSGDQYCDFMESKGKSKNELLDDDYMKLDKKHIIKALKCIGIFTANEA